MFVEIEMKAALVVAAIGLLVIWAVAFPESFADTTDTVASMVRGAYNGAT